MIDLGGPAPPPNPAWHDALFRGWRPDYPDPVPLPALLEDGLLFRAAPLYPGDGAAADAPLLPGARESGGDVAGHGDGRSDPGAARPSMLGRLGIPTAPRGWGWVSHGPLGGVSAGIRAALSRPGVAAAYDELDELMGMRTGLPADMAVGTAPRAHPGLAAWTDAIGTRFRPNLDMALIQPLRDLKWSLQDARVSRGDPGGHGAAPDAGGFGSGFDPGTGMGPGPQGEPW